MTVKSLIDRVLTALYAHEPHVKVVVAVTGGGTSASEMLFRSGSSSTMLQYTVPYHRSCLQSYVDVASDYQSKKVIPKFVSAEMAESMAVSAWTQAQQILWNAHIEDKTMGARTLSSTICRFRVAVGVGCTAALSTNYERRGHNGAYISICRVVTDISDDRDTFLSCLERRQCETYHVHLDKDVQRTRSEEDRIISEYIIYLLAKTTNVDPDAASLLLEALTNQRVPEDRFVRVPFNMNTSTSGDSLSTLFSTTELTSLFFLPSETTLQPKIFQNLPFRGLVMSGSFNPLHQGHMDLARAAQKVMKHRNPSVQFPIAFEIAVSNADKGQIALMTVMERIQQFIGSTLPPNCRFPVLVTNAAMFRDKAKLLNDCVFVIGADTAIRLVDKKYYDNDEYKMVLVLHEMSQYGSQFVVAGRFVSHMNDKGQVEKHFVSAEDVLAHYVPSLFRHLFIPIPEQEFRNDLSSTQLRNDYGG